MLLVLAIHSAPGWDQLGCDWSAFCLDQLSVTCLMLLEEPEAEQRRLLLHQARISGSTTDEKT